MVEKTANELFERFVMELDTIGVRISSKNDPSAEAYAVVGGTSNLRWWLIPLKNRLVAASGLALFQPYRRRSKIMKTIASILSGLGLSLLWARNKTFLSGSAPFDSYFPGKEISYAFFTGTDCPHRKTSAQIMDNMGTILGYAKITRSKNVKSLLKNEAKALERVLSLNLDSAFTPRVLFSGNIGGTEVLVTDTLKTNGADSPKQLNSNHMEFLIEIATKTNTESINVFLEMLYSQYRALSDRLSGGLRKKLEPAIDFVNCEVQKRNLYTTLSHGDFTLWNTFIVEDRLYVFDWEYAFESSPPAYDLLHFLIQKGILGDSMSSQELIDLVYKNKDLIDELVEASGSEKIPAEFLLATYITDVILKNLGREDPAHMHKYVQSSVGKTHLALLDKVASLVS